MSPAEFLKDVRKGKRFEIVVFRGNEEYLLRQVQQEYLDKILTPEFAAFDYTEFRSTDVDGGTLWNALTTLPLMSDRRVVLWEVLGEVKQDAAEALARYAARPSEKTALILILMEARDSRLAGMFASGHVTDVEFRELYENDRAAWAEKYVQKHGKVLHPDALRYVVETSSKNLSDLAAKLNHVILYVGDVKEITVQELMKVSGVSSEYSVFDLEAALMARKPEQAHRIARSLLEGGEALLRLVAFHRGMVLKLWQVKSALKKPSTWERSEEGAQTYAAVFGRQLFRKDAYKQTAKQLDEERIRQAVTGLLEVEVRAKSESQDPYYYYEWLWRLASSAPLFKEPVF